MPASYAYQYNAANQRDRVTLADGSYWVYAYDALGQVTSGKPYWKDSTPVAGQQYEYGFDAIGNRTSTKAGGDSAGGSLRLANYTANPLNQYSTREVPGHADVLGLAPPAQSVTVNGSATYRKGEYFHQALATPNASAAWNGTVTVVAGAETTSGSLYVPQSPESFSYDLDGNLTQDGRWTYTWDAENRLVRMVSRPGAPAQYVVFGYDWQGRRISKKAWNNTDGSGAPVVNERYLYDGWNLIAILDGAAATMLKSFVWGTDLSGTSQGAGGVGGLLKVRQHSPSAANAYVAYDGNGNVVGLVNTADGKFSARYEYGPFGEVVRATGPMAKANPFRFSTKYQDDETDLLYYGYRYYNASTGRWPSRDPIGENDGPNLYAFLRNDGLNKIDFLGLEWIIKREGQPRAEAWATSSSDTFDGLARKIRFDTSDYKKWALTSDDKPDPCKKYSIPNTIYIDFGEFKVLDQIPWAIISIWRSQANRDKADWEGKGFLVPTSEGVIDSEITGHLGSPNTHGYVFIGHGAEPGIINAYSHLGEDMSGTIPDRYTSHGIAFLTLKACYSAAKSPTPGKRYKYNAWESNVATRGWFVGYEGSVHTLNELFQWAAARGQNNKP